MDSIWARLKNTFTLKVPERFEDAFREDSAYKNNWRFAILPIFNILTQLACYYIYLYIYPATYPELPRLDHAGFTAFSLIYIAINVCFIVLFFRMFKKRGRRDYAKKSHVLTLVFLVSYVLLEGFETTLEVDISGNVYRFLATFFIVAFLPVLPRMQKFIVLLIYAAWVEAGLFYLIQNGMSNTNQYPEIIFAFFIVCVVVANIAYTGTVRTFTLNRSLLEANEKLRVLSVTDPLTGLYNRRAFHDYIARMWDEAKRDSGIITVIMLDIDNFKQYNDNYGHQKGDECIVAVAQCIQSFFQRSIDMVARYGGEEFIVLLPHTKLEDAREIGEALRQEVWDMQIKNDFIEKKFVSISIGIASAVPGIDDKCDQLVKRADDALYEAKNSGKNKVCSAAE